MRCKLTIGEKIADLIHERGITADKLSKDLNISKGTISDLINNADKNFGYKNFMKLSNYFNVSVDYLLGLSDVKTSNEDIKFINKYIGLSAESINRLHKAWNKNGTTFSNLINFIISDFTLISLINDYFKSFVYDEIETNEKFRLIPRSKISESEEIIMKKIFFANIIERLPKIREKFVDSLTEEEKEQIILKYLFNNADIQYCEKLIYGYYLNKEYYPTEKEQIEADIYYQSQEYQNKVIEEMHNATIYQQKEFDYINWFLSKYEEYKKENK